MPSKKAAPIAAPLPQVPVVTQPAAITVTGRNWVREAISDDKGLADIAYVSIGALTGAAIVSCAYVIGMETISYYQCERIVDVGEGQRAALSCQFDALKVGQAIGLIFAAFSSLIISLSGYMLANKRPRTGDAQKPAQ